MAASHGRTQRSQGSRPRIILQILLATIVSVVSSSPLNITTLDVESLNGTTINCQGSFWCSHRQDFLGKILDFADQIPNFDIWAPGDDIICFKDYPYGAFGAGLCLFLQGDHPPTVQCPITRIPPVVGVMGYAIKQKLTLLHKFGCRGCGSVPMDPNGDAAVSGYLTVNYVSGLGACQKNGICDATYPLSSPANPWHGAFGANLTDPGRYSTDNLLNTLQQAPSASLPGTS